MRIQLIASLNRNNNLCAMTRAEKIPFLPNVGQQMYFRAGDELEALSVVDITWDATQHQAMVFLDAGSTEEAMLRRFGFVVADLDTLMPVEQALAA